MSTTNLEEAATVASEFISSECRPEVTLGALWRVTSLCVATVLYRVIGI